MIIMVVINRHLSWLCLYMDIIRHLLGLCLYILLLKKKKIDAKDFNERFNYGKEFKFN